MNVFLDMKQRTAEWGAFRAAGPPGNPYPCAIGASEVAMALGLLGPEEQRWLWALKTGLEVDDGEPNWAMSQGIHAEPVIKRMYEAQTGLLGKPLVCYDDQHPFMLASLDHATADHKIIAEFKYHGGADHALVRRGHVPFQHFCQLQAQLICSGAEVLHLVSYRHRGGPIDNGVIAMIPVFPDPVNTRLSRSSIIEGVEEFCKSVRDGTPIEWTQVGSRKVVGMGGFTLSPQPQGGASTPLADDETAHSGPPTGPDEAQPRPERDAIVVIPSLGPMASYLLLERFMEERDGMVKEAMAVTVSDEPTEAGASSMLKLLTAAPKQIYDARLVATKPYRDVVEKINAAADAFVQPLVDAKAYVKQQLALYADKKRIAKELAERERRRAQDEAAAKAAALRAEGKIIQAEAVVEEAKETLPAIPEVGAVAGLAGGRKPDFTITDPDVVDRSMCSPDDRKIRARMSEMWKAFDKDEARFTEWAKKQAGLEFTIKTDIRAR